MPHSPSVNTVRFIDLRRLAVRWLLLASLVCICGCANVVKSPDLSDLPGLPLLAKTQLSQDSVIVEVGFVPVPENAEEWRRQIWAELDEQHVDPELRRKLAANGFRCGLTGTQLPTGLRAALDVASEDHSALMDTKDRVAEQTLMHRRIQTRAGKRSEVIMCAPRDSMVVLLHDEVDVVGRTFKEAQPLIALRSFPLGDGRVRVETTPEIQHGPSRQRWIGQDGAFQLDAGQHREVFARLMMETVLAPGQTLVIAGSGASRSIGGNFFGLDQDDRKEKMLLIRLAQSQYDDLFSPSADSMAEVDVLEMPEVDAIGGDAIGAGVVSEPVSGDSGQASLDGLTIDLE